MPKNLAARSPKMTKRIEIEATSGGKIKNKIKTAVKKKVMDEKVFRSFFFKKPRKPKRVIFI